MQRFRSEQAGEPVARGEVHEVARLLRRLGRKLRALDTAVLAEDERLQLERLLRRANSRMMRTLALLAR